MDPMRQLAQAIRDVKGMVPQIVTGTVQNETFPGNRISVVLDNDPRSDNAVAAINLIDYAPQGARVLCIKYPPRGLVVVGSLDSQTASVQSGMRHASNYQAATATTITSLTYVPLSTAVQVTIPTPPSRTLTVTVGGRMGLTSSGPTATDAGVLGFEIRETDAAGAVLLDPSVYLAGDAVSAVMTYNYGGIAAVTTNRSYIGRTSTVSITTTAPTIFIRAVGRVNTATASMAMAQTNLSVIPSP